MKVLATWLFSAAVALSGVVTAGCMVDPTPGPTPTPERPPTPGPTPPEPTPSAPTKAPGEVGPSGGHLELAGVQFDVPANALGQSVTISVTAESAHPEGYVVDGVVYRFQPDGLVFSTPITVSFPTAVPNHFVFWTLAGSDDTFEPLATTVENGRITAHPTHFSKGFAGAKKPTPKPCDGASEESCGNCGARKRTCNDGVWSEWSACEGQGACTPNATETCEAAGTRTCSGKCQWSQCEPKKTCDGPSSEACGNCGTRTRSCDAKGQWSEWSACTDEGVCALNATQACGTGGTQTCTAACAWGACTGQTCTGASSEPCGNCGARTRSCNNGTWSEWSACGGEGVCTPNATEACGSGGTRTCNASCSWNSCVGQTCTGSSTQPCGNCGTQSRTCNNGTWSSWSACTGEGVCTFGDLRACGTNGTQGCDASCNWSTCFAGITCTNVQRRWLPVDQICISEPPTVVTNGGTPAPVEGANLQMMPDGADQEGAITTGARGITYQQHGFMPFLRVKDTNHTKYETEYPAGTAERDRSTGIVTFSYASTRLFSGSGDYGVPADCWRAVRTQCMGSTTLLGCEGSSFQSCGNCGTRTRTCSYGGWSNAWSTCTGEGVCAPGSTQTCGTNGTQTCTASCQWDTCPGQTCEGPSTQTCNGGCGTQTRSCNGGVWSNWSPCSGTCGGTVTDMAFGTASSCFVQNQQRYCSGRNSGGSFAIGATDTNVRLTPELATTGYTFASFGRGPLGANCGLLADGTAYCWGPNQGLQFGSDRSTPRPTPIEMSPGTKFTQISPGYYATCGLTTTGAVICYGDSGLAGITNPPPPKSFAGPWTAVATGNNSGGCGFGGNLVCALDPTGAAYCWGSSNCYGELGNPSADPRQYYADPMVVAGAHTFTTISTGYTGACAVDTSGIPYCWGLSYDESSPGAGASVIVVTKVPTAIAAPAGEIFTDVQGGFSAACGLTASGHVYCWGGAAVNGAGLLGQGTTDKAPHRTATLVPGLPTIKEIAFDGGSCCALSTTGERWCWGSNRYGQLGDGSTQNVLSPKKVP
ncbi:MAG TPA: hypothetical protein VM925_24155 [Labilithrix sp.]|nr:hypothetical protein [Labilithrix sp.]